MRLRTKLSMVLALLVSTLVANVALSVWSIRFLEQELSLPLHAMQSVLQRLHEIKRIGEGEIDLISDSLNSTDMEMVEATSSLVLASEFRTARLLGELELLPGVQVRSGVRTIGNLQSRSSEIERVNREWSESKVSSDAQRLIQLIDIRHELIERIEGQILEDTRLSVDFSDTLRMKMYSSILVTLLGALVIGIILVLFLQRWVLRPIEKLRAGASRMSMGEFDQPVSVHSRDELGQLSEDFNRMGVLIQEMQNQRIESERLSAIGEMAQRTVHNFRTPLAGIRALSETTLDELEEDSELRDFQQRIIATVDRFELWLKDMLRTSSPLTIERVQFDPMTLVESIVQAHRGAAEAKGQSILLDTDCFSDGVVGDAHHLSHAITAILSNAIDFAPASSEILIHLGLGTGADEGYWTLRVSNDGASITEDLHRSIFRPYFTTRASGTGIGLAMAHRVVVEHGGRIDVESPLDGSSGMGCAFTMVLPLESV
jgi:signal transduction histidine kinase